MLTQCLLIWKQSSLISVGVGQPLLTRSTFSWKVDNSKFVPSAGSHRCACPITGHGHVQVQVSIRPSNRPWCRSLDIWIAIATVSIHFQCLRAFSVDSGSRRQILLNLTTQASTNMIWYKLHHIIQHWKHESGFNPTRTEQTMKSSFIYIITKKENFSEYV